MTKQKLYYLRLLICIVMCTFMAGCVFMGTGFLGKSMGMGSKTTRVKRLKHVRIPNNNGQLLNTDIYLPKKEGSYPTLIMQTAYSKTAMGLMVKMFAERSYNVVIQDSRGRYRSEGDFVPFLVEAEDARALLKWVRSQEWFNGKVGILGISYMSMVSWNMADKALSAQMPIDAMTSFMATGSLENFFFPGGNLPLHNVLAWANTTGKKNWELSTFLTLRKARRHLPLITSDNETPLVQEESFVDGLFSLPRTECFQTHLEGEPGREAFLAAQRLAAEAVTEDNAPIEKQVMNEESNPGSEIAADCVNEMFGTEWKTLIFPNEKYERVAQVPILWLAGWYDMFSHSQLREYETVVRLNPEVAKKHRLIIGPQAHGPYATLRGDLHRQGAALKYMVGELLNWYDYHLKGIENGVEKEAPVNIFVLVSCQACNVV